jgi:hypothetical protein
MSWVISQKGSVYQSPSVSWYFTLFEISQPVDAQVTSLATLDFKTRCSEGATKILFKSDRQSNSYWDRHFERLNNDRLHSGDLHFQWQLISFSSLRKSKTKKINCGDQKFYLIVPDQRFWRRAKRSNVRLSYPGFCSVKVCESLWKSVKVCESLWKSVKVCESL